jgi:[ribosomal protein S18]-alanine N-acetyltransferase
MTNFTSVSIHWAARSDRAEMLRIERLSFSTPWNDSIMASFLKQKNASAFVAKHEERVVGFVLAEKVDNFLHIVDIAVEPEMRHCGIGTQLVQRLIELLGGKLDRIITEVREGNVITQRFLKALEFRCTAIEKDSPEDSYEFQHRLDWSPSGEEVLKSIMQGDGRVLV